MSRRAQAVTARSLFFDRRGRGAIATSRHGAAFPHVMEARA